MVWKVGDPFTIENVEVAVPQKGEVRVRVSIIITSTKRCKEMYFDLGKRKYF